MNKCFNNNIIRAFFFLQESGTPDIKKLIEISSPTRVFVSDYWLILQHLIFSDTWQVLFGCVLFYFNVVFVLVEQVVCCRLTPVQMQLYKVLIQSKALRMELNKSKTGSGITASSLAFITQLKKLTNRKEKCLLSVKYDNSFSRNTPIMQGSLHVKSWLEQKSMSWPQNI